MKTQSKRTKQNKAGKEWGKQKLKSGKRCEWKDKGKEREEEKKQRKDPPLVDTPAVKTVFSDQSIHVVVHFYWTIQ